MADRHPSTTQLLEFFEYDHLPPHLQPVSAVFHRAAHDAVDQLPDDPELTVALRKLLEGKDAAVRCAVRARRAAEARQAAESGPCGHVGPRGSACTEPAGHNGSHGDGTVARWVTRGADAGTVDRGRC
jgi:hypothetical protein